MSLSSIAHDQEYHSHPHAPTPDGMWDAGESNTSNGIDKESDKRDRRRRARTCTRIGKAKPKYGRPGRPKHAALTELLSGTALYLTCIFLPRVPGYVYLAYVWCSSWTNYLRERMLWSIWIVWRLSLAVLERMGYVETPYQATDGGVGGTGGEDVSAMGGRRFGGKVGKFLFSTSTASLMEEFDRRRREGMHSPNPDEFTWGFGRTSSAFPAVVAVLQDVQLLIALAVLLAAIRVWFVHMLVPDMLAPRRLGELARCKSSHLLSSSAYSFGGGRSLSRSSSKEWEEGGERGWSHGERRRGLDRGSPMGEAKEEGRGWYARLIEWASQHWFRLRPSIRRALGHEPSARYPDILAERRRSSLSSSSFLRTESTADPARHLFSAPRHATATFRLLYTTSSCMVALILFRSAEFWPRHVFGSHPRANTRECWDLSGSISALGFLDDDYDSRNGALKYFFLAQAAYQLHSLCFHVVSMLLLLLYGGGGAEGSAEEMTGWIGRIVDRLWGRLSGLRHRQTDMQQRQPREESMRLISMKTSTQSYIRPMLEHIVVLALLVGAYLFSGLRRLGAVGIFTLELSSVFLQLLQVCIYAPEGSHWRRPEVVLFVHRTLTVPAFVYCRLVVLPFVLWRSALFESQEWLENIEKVFSPGWDERLYIMFNGSLCVIFALNLVLFRRLLFHPHLREIKQQRKEGY
ncbi:hypothetical protein ACHAWF_005139 [Thalassiosira exigua]